MTQPQQPNQGERPPGTHQDNTAGSEWIKRLERPERIPGLKIDEVIASLGLKPGDVVADQELTFVDGEEWFQWGVSPRAISSAKS